MSRSFSSNNDEESRTENISSAESLMNSGKKNLLLSSVPAAVSDFASACQHLTKVYGETSVECGEAYYYYGKALLELSRLESGVLGNALDGVEMDTEEPEGDASTVEDPNQLSKDEKLEVETKVAEALEENFENHDRVAKAHELGAVEEVEEDMDEDDEEDCQETTVEEGKKDEIEDEDPSNLQLAWEMLELAKLVYSKAVETSQGDKKTEYVTKLGASILCLGEVSLENENYSQAVEDFAECLKVRTAHLPPDSRSIAETHYQLGVAHTLHSNYKEAEPHLNNAICALERRIDNLCKMETSDNLASEVRDLQSLVAEIKEKICDNKAMERASALGKQEGSTIGFSGTDNKPISSIGIKKKVDLSSGKASGSATVGSA